jgi:N-acetylglucosamine-6-sulfatase
MSRPDLPSVSPDASGQAEAVRNEDRKRTRSSALRRHRSLGLMTVDAGRYNVVVLLSDDQRADKVTPEYMPNVWEMGGTRYRHAFVPNPLCGPSRASILTGNHSHTHGVWRNRPPHGGAADFDPTSTIATDFHDAGYRTALVGKYLNGYQPSSGGVPPGWDRWFAVAGSSKYYDYEVNSNGRILSFGSEPEDYITRVMGDRAIRFVERSTDRPFFLYCAFAAPHRPATPDPLDVSRFAGETNSRLHDNMLEVAYGMDRAIGRLLAVLPSNTIVAFLTDNGYLWGEPKAGRGPLRGKRWPYRESIKIPFILKALDGSLGFPDRAIALNIDLRRTIGSVAGLATSPTDGIDLTTETRSVSPLEHFEERMEPPISSYCGAREVGWMYVRYADGTEELLDEPDERSNVVDDPSHEADLLRLRDVAVTLCDPPPPGYSWGS